MDNLELMSRFEGGVVRLVILNLCLGLKEDGVRGITLN